jgi:hypothetical protein
VEKDVAKFGGPVHADGVLAIDNYLAERFHQGIGGQLIRNVGPTNDNGADGKVACRARLGGILNFYYREAE